jgi:hypothetical protein
VGVAYVKFGEIGPRRGSIEGGKIMFDKRFYVAVNMVVDRDIDWR